jgi:hypothetical protein
MKTIWDETTIRYVAFLDIMGFSDLVYRSEHLVVKEKMTKLSTLVKDIIQNKGKDELKSVIFSDSILIISKNSTKESLDGILFTLQNFFVHCLVNKIPLKGSVSKGLFTANFESSLFFGQPIIDAFKLQEELQMYGVILDHNTEEDISKYKDLYEGYCLSSPVPTKNGNITHTSINWMMWYNTLKEIEQIERAEVETLKDIHMKPEPSLKLVKEFFKDMSGYPRKYVDNTIRYIEENCEQTEK